MGLLDLFDLGSASLRDKAAPFLIGQRRSDGEIEERRGYYLGTACVWGALSITPCVKCGDAAIDGH